MALFKRKKNMETDENDYGKVLGDSLNFGAAEAYRLLRTNLNFSLPDVTGCKIIGVTSTLRGEGKSTTSINIAYTIAQTGKKVLLVEADLRLPVASKRLKVEVTPGLSNLLVGQCNGAAAIQRCDLSETLRVVTAGDIPPNPAELLNSDQMEEAIKVMADCFDVIIVDLPPISVVSDALIVSRLLSGMIVVVRESICSRRDLNETIRQLKFTDCKILGFVMTNAGSRDKKYGYYKKKRYGYDYGYSYGYGYGYGTRKRAPKKPQYGKLDMSGIQEKLEAEEAGDQK